MKLLTVFYKPITIILSVLACTLFFSAANAHVSEQGFVLLLPTRFYISAGVAAVALTVLILAFTPAHWLHKVFSPVSLFPLRLPAQFAVITSLLSLLVVVALIVLGVIGSRDPLLNPLPLYIWTVWWIGLVVLQGLIGNIWYFLNPWNGLMALAGKIAFSGSKQSDQPIASSREPEANQFPALIWFLVFAWLLLVYPAPDDPFRLAVVVIIYVSSTFLAMLLFGQQYWLVRAEFITVLMRAFARLSPLGMQDGKFCIGMPGWKVLHDSAATGSGDKQPEHQLHTISAALFVLVLLGVGSFDGLNETFWWLSLIGVNPLEFPGRSAIVIVTTLGLLGASLLLILIFALCVFSGNVLARDSQRSVTAIDAFRTLAISVLPIAFAYHIAHFLTAFLVNIQYTLAATSDPLSSGADWLSLGQFYVTTGFLNTPHTVEAIWLTQAGVVVIGHIISVMLAHALACRLYGDTRRAMISQIPLAAFMILYTCLGLWLLASPKGA